MIESILNECWNNYENDYHPIDRRMSHIKEKLLKEFGDHIYGMTTENIQLLINEIVKRLGGNYLEVGIYRGASLISAAMYNDNVRCIGIDNFSQFGAKTRVLKRSLDTFKLSNIEWYDMDYRDAIKNLDFFKESKVDVYYYDGEHGYEPEKEGLILMEPFLNDKCIVCVDDINNSENESAVYDFIKLYPEFKIEVKIYTEGKKGRDKKWWNGFMVLSRGFNE